MFAKRGTQDWLADALRAEYRTLGLIDADFQCEVIGWEDGERPLLVLEDLREAHWPPPWRPGDVDRVLAALERMWALVFQGERVVLVDWNWAVHGPAELDLACWLPSLRLDGGPSPEQVSPGLGGYAAAVASYFATAAALPPVPDSPRLRRAQLEQLKIALPWACRELGLPEPDRLPQ